MVAKAWEVALRRKSVDRDADFRHVGMDSNRAMQIIREIWWATGIDLPVNFFYMAPTIRRMAAGIRDGSALVEPDLIRLRDGDDSAPVFLFPGGARVLFEFHDLVTAFEQKTGPYRLAGYSICGITALESARLIRQEGEDRIFLGRVDTPQNDHSWPLRV